MRRDVVAFVMSIVGLGAVGCSRSQATEGAAETVTTAAESSGTCSATQLDTTPIATATAPLGANGKPDYTACRNQLEPQVRAAVCTNGGASAYMYRYGNMAAMKMPILCPPASATSGTTTLTAATTTAAASPHPATPPPAAAPAPTHAPEDLKPGGVGTCTAMRLDGSVIALESAPASRGGLSHDYVACRAKIEPKIRAVVCAGKTSGFASYLYKIGGSAPAKSEMLCK